jgi:PE-PPE domain
MNDPSNRQTYGDTTYITIPAMNLPLLQPLLDIGIDTGTSWLTKPIVDLIQPTLRVLIELGYNRSIPYGQPTPAGLFPAIDLVALAANLAAAVGQGIRDALTDLDATNTSALAPSTTANPSTLANVPEGDSPAATTQTTQPRSQSQSSTSTSLGAPAAAPTPNTGTDLTAATNTRGASPAAADKDSAVAASNSRAHQPNGTTSTVLSLTSAAAKTIPSGSAASVATKPEKPTVATPTAPGSPRFTLPDPSGIGTPNRPSTRTAVPTGGAGTNTTHPTSSDGGTSTK